MNGQSASQGVPKIFRILIMIAGGLLILLFWPPLWTLLKQILFGILLSALALPICKRLEKHLSPSISALLAIGMLVLGVIGAFALLVPHIIAQISLVIAQAPQLLSRLQSMWEELARQEWVAALGMDVSAPREWLKSWAAWLGDNLPRVLSSLGSWADGISKAFLSPLLAYYFLRDRALFSYRLCLWIPARHRKRALAALQEMRREAGGYLRGQMLVALSVGVLTALGLMMAGIPAWLALGLLMGLCELIPYVGPLIGTIPIVVFSLPMGVSALLWALGISVAVQQIEGWFLSPHLMAGATGLHPVYVVLLLSAGGMIWGLMGMVIALPLFVCIRGAARVLYETREEGNVKISVSKGKMPY